jgi:hypothetical protein
VTTPLDRLSPEARAEMDQAVYASYGRLVAGAPPPPGTVTIHATDRADFHRQVAALFGDAPDEEPAPGDADPDSLRTPRPPRDAGASG